jgi:hypothetical protein
VATCRWTATVKSCHPADCGGLRLKSQKHRRRRSLLLALTTLLFFDGASPVDLNELLDTSGAGWNLTNATDINDRFQVVGYGTIGGTTRAFRLDLIVPEPTVCLSMLSGMVAGLFTRARGR